MDLILMSDVIVTIETVIVTIATVIVTIATTVIVTIATAEKHHETRRQFLHQHGIGENH